MVSLTSTTFGEVSVSPALKPRPATRNPQKRRDATPSGSGAPHTPAFPPFTGALALLFERTAECVDPDRQRQRAQSRQSDPGLRKHPHSWTTSQVRASGIGGTSRQVWSLPDIRRGWGQGCSGRGAIAVDRYAGADAGAAHRSFRAWPELSSPQTAGSWGCFEPALASASLPGSRP